MPDQPYTDKSSAFKFYGRRIANPLRQAEQKILDTHGPKLLFDMPQETVDLAQLFDDRLFQAYGLEIGFGGGEHLAWQAENQPNMGFIGAEPFLNGVVKLMRSVAQAQLDNVKILNDNARELLPQLPASQFDVVYILYADPWPKRKQQKRRIVCEYVLDQVARILKPGGVLRLASDIDDYVSWMLAHLLCRDDFLWLARDPVDWQKRPADWPSTRYEAKAIQAGRTPTYLELKRV